MYIKIGTTKCGKIMEITIGHLYYDLMNLQSNWYHQTKNIGIITYIVMEGKCI